jgi:tetratricopeptide (TPR) repeat protein
MAPARRRLYPVGTSGQSTENPFITRVSISRRAEGRPHLVPPAPAPLDRTQVLMQMETTAGLVLWRALVDARLWGDAPAAERRRLFRAPTADVRERFALACEEIPALAPAFGTFALMLRSPDLATSEQVGSACALVHAWADQAGLRTVALRFAEAAAHADPESPARANLAARSARRAMMYDRAGTWHMRAYKLAVRARNRGETVWALMGYGAMMKATDRIPEARRFLQRATRRAMAFGRRKEAAVAHHELMGIAVDQERYRLAELHAGSALALYPGDHPSLPALGHDFAFVLLRQKHYSTALPLLEQAAPLLARPDERGLAMSSLAWAAAGAGRLTRLTQAECATLELVAIFDAHAPAVFLHLAEAFCLAGDVERAGQYADEAARAAQARGEIQFVREAAEMRIQLRNPSTHAPRDVPPGARTLAIRRDLTARLKKWKKAPD